MEERNILIEIKENIQDVIEKKTSLGKSLWQELLTLHPADIADFLQDLERNNAQLLFSKLSKDIQFEVFEYVTDSFKVFCLSFLSESRAIEFLNSLSIDELTDLFDYFSDEQLKHYLNLLHKKAREKVLALLKFHPQSAGGIMDTEVLSLVQDFTVEKSIKILQRLRSNQEIYRQIFVTDKEHALQGHINLEDLVLQDPKDRLKSFLRKNDLVAQADDDQEDIAKKMVHYSLTIVPVVSKGNHFLGAIPSETLMDVLVEEASEDVQKMAAMTPMKQTYLESSIWSILLRRGWVLVALLLLESFTRTIIGAYEETLPHFLLGFVTMLLSTGGNTSHQTSALVLGGMASGEIHDGNMYKFLKREMVISFLLASILGVSAFGRAFSNTGKVLESFAIGLSLGAIVMVAIILGSCVPFLLKRFNIDPAFAGGPFLATLVDILGVFIYCFVLKVILFS